MKMRNLFIGIALSALSAMTFAASEYSYTTGSSTTQVRGHGTSIYDSNSVAKTIDLDFWNWSGKVTYDELSVHEVTNSNFSGTISTTFNDNSISDGYTGSYDSGNSVTTADIYSNSYTTGESDGNGYTVAGNIDGYINVSGEKLTYTTSSDYYAEANTHTYSSTNAGYEGYNYNH